MALIEFFLQHQTNQGQLIKKKTQLLMFSETELRHASGPNDLPVTEPQENQTLCARQQDGEYLWTKQYPLH